jgi:hypothetical protein
MTLSRAFLLVLAVWPLSPAAAEPRALPPVCQRLLATKDQVLKHSQAVQIATRKKAPLEEICKLFNVFLAAETRMVKDLEERRVTCGIPRALVAQVKAIHGKTSAMGKQLCDVTAQWPAARDPECVDTLWARLACPMPADD